MIEWTNDLIKQGDYKIALLIDEGISHQLAWAFDRYDKESDVIEAVRRFITTNIFNRVKDFNGLFLFAGEGSNNYRKQHVSTYKEDRKTRPQAKWLHAIKDFFTKKGKVIYDQLEADDVCVILHRYYEKQYKLGNTDFRTCIVSADKDLVQAGGHIFKPSRRLKGIEQADVFAYINEQDAEQWLWKQVLMGDGGDGVGGLYNVGITTASHIIEELPIMGNIVDTVRFHYKMARYKTEHKEEVIDSGGVIIPLETEEEYHIRVTELAELDYINTFKQVYIHRDDSYFKAFNINQKIYIPPFKKYKA